MVSTSCFTRLEMPTTSCITKPASRSQQKSRPGGLTEKTVSLLVEYLLVSMASRYGHAKMTSSMHRSNFARLKPSNAECEFRMKAIECESMYVIGSGKGALRGKQHMRLISHWEFGTGKINARSLNWAHPDAPVQLLCFSRFRLLGACAFTGSFF